MAFFRTEKDIIIIAHSQLHYRNFFFCKIIWYPTEYFSILVFPWAPFFFLEMKLLSHLQTQIPSSGSGLHLITFDNE